MIVHKIKCMNFQVFEVNQEEQEFYIRQEMFHRPLALQTNITVLEAKGLKTDSEGTPEHGIYINN